MLESDLRDESARAKLNRLLSRQPVCYTAQQVFCLVYAVCTDYNSGAGPISNGLSLPRACSVAGYVTDPSSKVNQDLTHIVLRPDYPSVGKAGRPKEALSIYVQVLDDLERTTAFCKETGAW